MQHISKVVAKLDQNGLQSKQNPLTEKRVKRHRAIVARLWVVMADTFMHKWNVAGDIGGACYDDWCNGLQDLRESEIVRGVNQLPHMKPDADGKCWPPSLPEFRALCRPALKEQCHRPAQLPPPPTATPGAISAARQKARAHWAAINGWKPKAQS